MDWQTSVRFLPGVGPVIAKRLAMLNIFTVQDLLWHLPFRYQDYRLISKINLIQEGEIVTLLGKIGYIKNIYTKFGKQIQKAIIHDQTGSISVTWFNQPYLVKQLPVGTLLAVSGKINRFGNKFQLASPDYEIVKSEQLLHSGRLVPVYPETEKISSKWLRSRMAQILDSSLMTHDYLPEYLITKYNFSPLHKAFSDVHFPQDLDQIPKAKNRLAFEELFFLELQTLWHRQLWQAQKQTLPMTINQPKIAKFIKKLPFDLTVAQQKVIQQILPDLQKTYPMNRLLQGDVGSGKTVVAAVSIYVAYLNQLKSVFMAPTEILVEQHFQTLKQLLQPWGLRIGIVTKNKKIGLNSSSNASKTAQFDVLVGTHALIQPQVQLSDIGLVVIDEQHRFGVRQRAILRQKGHVSHVLTMTATPIPRTVALTLYGDLDLSIIDALPPGRKTVKTWVVTPAKRTAAYNWIKQQINLHKIQVFVVCPFIEPSESIQSVKAAQEELVKLTKIFPGFSLGLLHGKLTSTQKQSVLSKFRLNQHQILVATPVVEVGIDVPNANIMLIESAERFGLAQLHQLRGRVGRNQQQSYCLLFPDNLSVDKHRLKFMEKVSDGLKLAEYDMKHRGPGQIFGIKQHGILELKAADFSDLVLIESARQEAIDLLDNDPQLLQFPALKQQLLSGTIPEVTPD